MLWVGKTQDNKKPLSFVQPNLHEEAGDQSLPDVQIIISAREIRATSGQRKSVHDASQLCTYVVTVRHRAVVHEVIEAPRGGSLICTIQ